MKYLTEAQRLKSNAEFAQTFSVKFDVPLSFPDKFNNFDGIRKLLVVHAVQPGITLTKSYIIAGMNAEEGVRIKNRLIADGMVYEHALVRKGSGAQYGTLELLKPAIDVLAQMKITLVELKGRGSFLHRIYVNRYLAEWAKSKSYKCWIERWLDPKCIDFVYEDEYSRLNAVEVYLSGDKYTILESGMKCASLQGIYSVVLAFNKRETMKSVKDILKNELPIIQQKISLKYLNEYWIGDEDEKVDGS